MSVTQPIHAWRSDFSCGVSKIVCVVYTFKRDPQESKSFEHCSLNPNTKKLKLINLLSQSHVQELRSDLQRDWLEGEMWHNVLLMLWWQCCNGILLCVTINFMFSSVSWDRLQILSVISLAVVLVSGWMSSMELSAEICYVQFIHTKTILLSFSSTNPMLDTTEQTWLH